MAETKRILITYAHPDDESFGIGAFIARMTAEGCEVSLVCATNGDFGTVAPEKLNGYKSIAELRLAELACAAQVLGFKEVITFGYGDSGMMGGQHKDEPGTLWAAPLDEVTGKVVDVIKRIRPQVVITFDRFGGYGHPDHIKIHQATHAAFDALRDDPALPQKLYYALFPKQIIRFGVNMIRLSGRDPRKMGVNGDLDFQEVLDHTETTTTEVDTRTYREVGERAAACHASQISPRQQFPMAQQVNRILTNVQRFHRAIPAAQPDEPLEFDLFSRVKLAADS